MNPFSPKLTKEALKMTEWYEFKNMQKKGIRYCCNQEDGTLWQHHPQEWTS